MTTDLPPPGQLRLFDDGASPPPDGGDVVGTARVDPAVATLAHRLPPTLRLGTSSWSYPGWAGIVYNREVRGTALARSGLAAYAGHPLMRTVGVDRSYHAPPPVEAYQRYAGSVSDAFRFVVKAHQWCTIARFPNHPRFGASKGKVNPHFLDSAYATHEVVAPIVEGLGARLGMILFQFPPQELVELSGRGRFPHRLDRFLAGLPSGPRYAVEIRNHQLFTPRYVAVLRNHDAVHCLNAHPTMHAIGHQIRHLQPLRDSAVLVRWMLRAHLRYEEARRRYSPFDCLVDPDHQTRTAIATLCKDAAQEGRPTFVIVSNKAEGSAPLSIEALAQEVMR